MNAALLTVAKDVSVWALAIIAVTVLKGDTASARVWYAKLGAGILLGLFVLILAISSVLLPRVGRAPISVTGLVKILRVQNLIPQSLQ